MALYLAYNDPRVPWYAKAWLLVVLAYAFSPIDLIPDFIPILGYLDDLILLPLAIMLATKLIPADLMTEFRDRAIKDAEGKPPVHWAGAVGVILVWLVVLGYLFNRFWR